MGFFCPAEFPDRSPTLPLIVAQAPGAAVAASRQSTDSFSAAGVKSQPFAGAAVGSQAPPLKGSQGAE